MGMSEKEEEETVRKFCAIMKVAGGGEQLRLKYPTMLSYDPSDPTPFSWGHETVRFKLPPMLKFQRYPTHLLNKKVCSQIEEESGAILDLDLRRVKRTLSITGTKTAVTNAKQLLARHAVQNRKGAQCLAPMDSFQENVLWLPPKYAGQFMGYRGTNMTTFTEVRSLVVLYWKTTV
jgi:hypothetical protein